MSKFNVFVRRSEQRCGSNHDPKFRWPEVGGTTAKIEGFRTYAGSCGPGYYGYALDAAQYYAWRGDHWLAFEAMEGAAIRDHGDKVAVSEATVLAIGDAREIRQYLWSRRLPVPRVLQEAASPGTCDRIARIRAHRARAIVDALAPDARRVGLAGIAYAIALDAAYRVGAHTRASFAQYHAKRMYIANRPGWRDLSDEETRRWSSWQAHGGERLCALADYTDQIVRDWRAGTYRPLPVADYARSPYGMTSWQRRHLDHVCAVMIGGKLAGWLDRMPPTRKLIKGMDTRKQAAREAKEAKRAATEQAKAKARAVRAASRAHKVMDTAETAVDKALKAMGVSTGWGNSRGHKYTLEIGGRYVETWHEKPSNFEVFERASRFLARGY